MWFCHSFADKPRPRCHRRCCGDECPSPCIDRFYNSLKREICNASPCAVSCLLFSSCLPISRVTFVRLAFMLNKRTAKNGIPFIIHTNTYFSRSVCLTLDTREVYGVSKVDEKIKLNKKANTKRNRRKNGNILHRVFNSACTPHKIDSSAYLSVR